MCSISDCYLELWLNFLICYFLDEIQFAASPGENKWSKRHFIKYSID